MNKKELVEAMAEKTASSAAAADRAVNALVEIFSDTLQKGESLTLAGFGTLKYAIVPPALAVIPRPARN